MPFLPAVCNACHTIFPSGIYVRRSQLHLGGFKASPCPHCKNGGQVPHGLYKFIDYTLSILKSESRNIIELTSLHDTILLAKEDELEQEHLEVIIKHELPDFLDLLLLLPKQRTNYMLCLQLLAQVVFAVIELSIKVDKEQKHKQQPIQLHRGIKAHETIEQIYTNNIGTSKRLF